MIKQVSDFHAALVERYYAVLKKINYYWIVKIICIFNKYQYFLQMLQARDLLKMLTSKNTFLVLDARRYKM